MNSEKLRTALGASDELALLDLREQGEFGACHLFWAVNAPLSRLEFEVARLVPRKSTPIVITTAGDAALAARSAETLTNLSYTDVSICPDTPDEWVSAGFTIYSGINVPSKAFGEAVEHHYATPSVHASELKAMQDRGDDLVVLDSRTFAEYRNMSIPQGISVPGGELAYRVRDLAPSDATTIVVNCAGRTRSILGAQSVINAGVPNKVIALENGTMGWHLAGLELDHGRTDRFPSGDPQTLDAAIAMRDRIAATHNIESIDRARLAEWQSEADRRTLYLLDVRDPDEFAAGHLPGSRSAPGGQLVQATDFQIGVPNGRIVLIDDTGVRATMAAHWLVQMGYREVYVFDGGLAGDLAMEVDTAMPSTDAPTIGVEDLAARLSDSDVAVLDLGESRVFRKGHIPGAKWAIRSRIANTGPALPDSGTLVLTSDDGRLAALAVEEARALTKAEVVALSGGTNAWIAAGRPTDADPAYPADEDCIDVYLRAYDRNTDIEARMQEYIDWEVALIDQIAADEDVQFKMGPSA
ncbi:MAG: rhodanese-like domain-containing protein [Proteobacteria bacterium]|nr:rhodanese-like domain-containing protein [Pseudomonadota bacterium]